MSVHKVPVVLSAVVLTVLFLFISAATADAIWAVVVAIPMWTVTVALAGVAVLLVSSLATGWPIGSAQFRP